MSCHKLNRRLAVVRGVVALQREAFPRLRRGEQGVQRGAAPQAHPGHERVGLHELPDGGGRGRVQEAVLPVHQERRRARHGTSASKHAPHILLKTHNTRNYFCVILHRTMCEYLA